MHQPMTVDLFVIKKDFSGIEWFLHDIDVKKTKANKWTKNPDNALTFDSRQDADDVHRKFNMSEDVYIDTITVTTE